MSSQSRVTVVERLKHIRPGENVWNADLPRHLMLNVKGPISQIYRGYILTSRRIRLQDRVGEALMDITGAKPERSQTGSEQEFRGFRMILFSMVQKRV